MTIHQEPLFQLYKKQPWKKAKAGHSGFLFCFIFCFVECHCGWGNFQSPPSHWVKATVCPKAGKAPYKLYSLPAMVSSPTSPKLTVFQTCHFSLLHFLTAQAQSCLRALYLQRGYRSPVPERSSRHTPATADSLIVTISLRAFPDTLKMQSSLPVTVVFLPHYFFLYWSHLAYYIFYNLFLSLKNKLYKGRFICFVAAPRQCLAHRKPETNLFNKWMNQLSFWTSIL